VEDKNEETIFDAAVEVEDPAERARFVAQACGGDLKLLADVEALLRSHYSHSRLDVPVLDSTAVYDESPLTEGPGTVIGRYKLLEKIGEGGMAVVYMAEQEHPIRRKVALKIIKLGMDTRQVIARFEAERQALALMDHPNIAKVLDAGATETGRPYFVMELVQGVSITEYCDGNNLGIKDRLALFVQVCHAVQHAHQKGIIHRDIKPSNVMVTHHDGKPVPKVIDFGIAKATNQRLTEKTLFTRYAHLIGTPAYMSPEQAELSDLDIDTRTDIYSLGVLLYELLTGTTPFSEEELRKAGYVEMQRVIREQEPVKPSTRIRTAHVAQPPPAGGTGVTPEGGGATCVPRTPYQQVRGDLDWIVMKTLEKDRSRRYDTAGGLAEDIRRHLEHEPVLARGPGVAYRVEKFLRRHRSQVFAAIALTVIAVAAVVILSLWNRDRAQLAEAEGFKHRGILSQAREQYAKAESETALATINPILQSRHVGPEARLLQATILVDNRRSEEAVAILNGLLSERLEIAGAAHSLLARSLWESGSPDAEKLKEIEEHRQKAEALLPETAEAYFLRAMTALTVKEQLAALDKALQLDPSHYESRRLRAFTYYASRKYDQLRDDALVMTVLRPRDSLGYSLRAVSWRELDRYPEAMADYDAALGLMPVDDSQYADLSAQRCETLLRMEEYERVIAEAQECFKLWPDRPAFQYYVFSAMTALGEYEKADALFCEIVRRTPTARNRFWFWAMKYVFDALEAGRPWHPMGHEPNGAAFLAMAEAEEIYRDLSAKAHRVVTDGFSAHWSPDGQRLAFSLGVRGYSGVAIYDPATKGTELVIVPGKDPRWSPDGKYIAFVRDCQTLRLEELTTSERRDQVRWLENEEVWVMNADGAEPRRVARGGWPSWSKDSAQVYYHSRLDRTLYLISVVGPDAEPKRIMACSDAYPSVSPDNQRVAYREGASLKIGDLASRVVLARWDIPLSTWDGPAWSPTGEEVFIGASGTVRDRTGLWVCRPDTNEPVKVLGSQIVATSWTADGKKLILGLRPPYSELWLANSDLANLTEATLGPTQTLDEHWYEMVRLCTRRIEADPQDAYAYSSRAQYHDYLHDREEARADMRRWSAVVSGGLATDSLPATPDDLRRRVDLPLNCELVFSAERPVNGIPMMSVAFGQKGRCEVKLFEIPMLVAALLGVGMVSGLDSPPAYAAFTLGEPVNLGAIVNSPYQDVAPCISTDGLELYFCSDRPGSHGYYDLWVSRRPTNDDAWGPPENLGPVVNGLVWVASPAISTDGLELYFHGMFQGTSSTDICMAKRTAKDQPWGAPVKLGPNVNRANLQHSPAISSDGLHLYFESGADPGDIWVSIRETLSDPWQPAVNLGPVVNTPYHDGGPHVSIDGLALFFHSDRPGGFGDQDLYVTTRSTTDSAWGVPTELGENTNTACTEGDVCVSADGCMLYFSDWPTARPGGVGDVDLWQVPIIPIVDFNADGTVDLVDLLILIERWGTQDRLCDVGPMPWGDGVVDMRDMVVLLKYMGETDAGGTDPALNPKPDALEVSGDVVLNWLGPGFADSYDVYLGTSFDDVSNATRDDPCGVLVSEGHAETIFDPEGLLEFGRTYYWRIDLVDVVIGSLEPVIYRGPVLKFTTEAFAYPITTNIIAKASNSQPGMGPGNTVNGSGLDKNDGHSTDGSTMWLSTNAKPHWIQFEFDHVYALHELWVWNSNQLVEPILGFGAKTVKVEYSVDGATWTTLDGVPEFARAPGESAYKPNTTVNFGGGSAKYVKLTIEANWGPVAQTGLAEVRFFYIPDRPWATTP
jgi:serine/threonine protein kinase/Tol biopolymer transport system component